jgi:hypothetical protein
MLAVGAGVVVVVIALWDVISDAYDNITGNWKRVANTRADMARKRAQRGSQTRGHV